MYWEDMPIGTWFKDWYTVTPWVYKKISETSFNEYRLDDSRTRLLHIVDDVPLNICDFQEKFSNPLKFEVVHIPVISLKETNYDHLLPS